MISAWTNFKFSYILDTFDKRHDYLYVYLSTNDRVFKNSWINNRQHFFKKVWKIINRCRCGLKNLERPKKRSFAFLRHGLKGNK